jgi:hypothetical protein
MRSRHVHRIFAAGQVAEAVSWAAACDVGAKWDIALHAGAADGEKASLFEEFVRGSLGIDELTLTLFKGIWHALEPGRDYLSSVVSDW